jgi:sec-independent protein translocase protein TatB
MSAELLLILLVALIVFGPTKLPMLAKHLGWIWQTYQQGKGHIQQLWEENLQSKLLDEHIQKAKEADDLYKKLKKHSEGQGHE